MKPEAVIFDYDGTLVQLNIDFDALRRDVERRLIEHSVELDKLKGLYILEMINQGTALISWMDPSAGTLFYHEAHGLVREHEIRAAEEGEIFPGVKETLKRLMEQEFKVGIITRNCKAAVEIIFPHIEQYCDVFIPRDDVKQVKPHPDHLAMVLERLAVEDPSQCLMVGDHILDIKAGKRMELKTAGVLTGKTTRLQFEEAEADLIFDDATKILKYVNEK
jgi:phosphoglycolate phosphatase